MRTVIGLLVVATIVLLSYKLYFSQMRTEGGTGSPVEAIDVVGVKNDLLAIAQAERAYQAEHGSYASYDQLLSSGTLTMRKPGRDGYTSDVETSWDSVLSLFGRAEEYSLCPFARANLLRCEPHRGDCATCFQWRPPSHSEFG